MPLRLPGANAPEKISRTSSSAHCTTFAPQDRGYLYYSVIRSSMLHGSETWPMTDKVLQRLERNDRAMIRWICRVKPSDKTKIGILQARLGLCDLRIMVRERSLR